MEQRLLDRSSGRIEKVKPAYTSQRWSACGCVDPKSRESQAGFRCTACDYTCNADVNAARNIAAGHAVNARRGDRVAGPAKREPQELLLAASSEILVLQGEEDIKTITTTGEQVAAGQLASRSGRCRRCDPAAREQRIGLAGERDGWFLAWRPDAVLATVVCRAQQRRGGVGAGEAGGCPLQALTGEISRRVRGPVAASRSTWWISSSDSRRQSVYQAGCAAPRTPRTSAAQSPSRSRAVSASKAVAESAKSTTSSRAGGPAPASISSLRTSKLGYCGVTTPVRAQISRLRSPSALRAR